MFFNLAPWRHLVARSYLQEKQAFISHLQEFGSAAGKADPVKISNNKRIYAGGYVVTAAEVLPPEAGNFFSKADARRNHGRSRRLRYPGIVTFFPRMRWAHCLASTLLPCMARNWA